MMTKTSLSAATWTSPKGQRAYSAPQRCLKRTSSPARDARRFRWHRHSCLCAVAKPIIQRIADAALSLPSKFLIANPRLTLRVNAIRICELRISNRKFLTIFRSEFSLFLSFEPHAISFQNLIVTTRLEITISPILSIPSNFLIVTKRTFLHLDSFAGADFCTLRPPKTRIQCGREGEPA
jgi:hypothetical protein